MMRGKAAYIERLSSRMRFRSAPVSDRLSGSSPPGVFIGKWNYPKVFAGPLMPPLHGNTAVMDAPEEWAGKNAGEIINFRLQLVRGKKAVHIKEGIEEDRIVSMIREIALAKNPVDMEMEFEKKPRGSFFSEEIQPFGPSGLMKQASVSSEKFEPHMEKAFYDTDMRARDAMLFLYSNQVAVSSIQKALSTAAFGLKKNRKLVPTRWSITAVDDAIGKYLLEKVKSHPAIGDYRVYETESLSNKFVVILFPSLWQYETMEAFFPQIIGDRLEIYGDSEGFEGKKGYAEIGGCYYSARLAIAEQLQREKRQAGAIVLRECYSDYIPLGVWNVRENMRRAMESKPVKLDSWEIALGYAKSRLRVPFALWASKSALISSRFRQSTLSGFAGKSETIL